MSNSYWNRYAQTNDNQDSRTGIRDLRTSQLHDTPYRPPRSHCAHNTPCRNYISSNCPYSESASKPDLVWFYDPRPGYPLSKRLSTRNFSSSWYKLGNTQWHLNHERDSASGSWCRNKQVFCHFRQVAPDESAMADQKRKNFLRHKCTMLCSYYHIASSKIEDPLVQPRPLYSTKAHDAFIRHGSPKPHCLCKCTRDRGLDQDDASRRTLILRSSGMAMLGVLTLADQSLTTIVNSVLGEPSKP